MPILVLGENDQALQVDDFQMSETQGVLKVSIPDPNGQVMDLLYTFNFEYKTLKLFEDVEPGLQMVASGPNSLLGLVKI